MGKFVFLLPQTEKNHSQTEIFRKKYSLDYDRLNEKSEK